MRCVLALLALCALTGCPAEPVLIVERDGGDADSGDTDGGAIDAVSCVGVEDGLACAPERHCIASRCVFNACGDGVAAFGEQCDDGNQALADDCTPSCRSIPAVCGDSRVSPSEQCDDGNRDDSDACSNLCVMRVAADAGMPSPLNAECPVLTSLVATPYAGEDERLVGNYFTVIAEFSTAPVYMVWRADEAGQMFTRRGDPFRISYQCEGNDPRSPREFSLFTAHPNCIANTYQIAVVCRP